MLNGQIMMIEDDELRSLYRLSSEEQLQKLEAGLLSLEEYPEDQTAIEFVLREVHSLKGDSRAVGLEEVADLLQAIETILKRVQRHEFGVTPAINAYLYQALNTIAQLIYTATTGEAILVNVTEVLNQLTTAVAQPFLLERETPGTGIAAISPLSPNFIVDEELREIYATTTEERLQSLESRLVQLATHPDDPDVLEQLRYQMHSLKGDARAVGVETIATLAEKFEDVLKHLQSGNDAKNPLIEGMYDCLYVSLDAIGQLVQEAVTGQHSQIEVSQVLEYLKSIPASPPEPAPSASSPVKLSSELQVVHAQPVPEDLELQSFESDGLFPSLTADPELWAIFKTTSEERLQTLEVGLARLEEQPDHPTVLAELLRETHSLKGDARSVGSQPIERLTQPD